MGAIKHKLLQQGKQVLLVRFILLQYKRARTVKDCK